MSAEGTEVWEIVQGLAGVVGSIDCAESKRHVTRLDVILSYLPYYLSTLLSMGTGLSVVLQSQC